MATNINQAHQESLAWHESLAMKITGFVGSMAISGVTNIELGDTMTKGDKAGSDSVGRAVPVGSDVCNGKVLESGVVGDIVPLLLKVAH